MPIQVNNSLQSMHTAGQLLQFTICHSMRAASQADRPQICKRDSSEHTCAACWGSTRRHALDHTAGSIILLRATCLPGALTPCPRLHVNSCPISYFLVHRLLLCWESLVQRFLAASAPQAQAMQDTCRDSWQDWQLLCAQAACCGIGTLKCLMEREQRAAPTRQASASAQAAHWLAKQ